MASGRELIEQPPAADAELDGEPIKQRTKQQQDKSDNYQAQQRREQGLESNRSRSQSRRVRCSRSVQHHRNRITRFPFIQLTLLGRDRTVDGAYAKPWTTANT